MLNGIHSILGNPNSSQTRERKEKGIQIGKEEARLSLYAYGMILCIKNPQVSTQKLLELINEFSKVAGYKINIKKSVAFLYTNNEITEKECRKILPFNITSSEIKELNLTKKVKDICQEL